MIFVGLEGTKAGERIEQRSRWHQPFLLALQARDQWLQWSRGKSVPLRDYQRLVGSEALLVRGSRRYQGNRHGWYWFAPAITGALLKFPQLSAQPAFIARAIENQGSVATPQVLFVVLANFRLVALEHRSDDFQFLFEQKIFPWRSDGRVALIVDEVEPDVSACNHRTACLVRPGRRLGSFLEPLFFEEPVLDHGPQIFEKGLQ